MSSEGSQSQKDDVVVDEINYYLQQYEKCKNRFRNNHKLTRRLSILSIFWAVLSLTLLFSNTILEVDLITLKPYQFIGFDVINWHLIIFWPLVVAFLSVSNFSKLIKAIWFLEFGVFLAFFSKETIGWFAVIHIALFVTCYALNRMNGYTRGWSRNRLAVEHLKRLTREYLIAIKGQSQEFIRIEQENTLAKLFEIDTKHREAAHTDIVGDYIAVNNGAFGWIKGLKK